MGFLTGLFNVLLVLCSFFLICLVLIQRGKGGGLAGAFGGVGGSSAFGTKAGDVFTRVTIVTAIVWFLLNIGLVVLANQRTGSAFRTPTTSSKEVPVSDSAGKSKGTAAPSSESAPKSSEKAAETPASKPKDDLPPVFEEPAKEKPAAAPPASEKKTP